MPTLHEVQRAMRAGLIGCDTAAVAAMLPERMGLERLDIYRNTIFFGLARALRLAFPAVVRLVGEDFFKGAAETFATQNLPRAPCLDLYGSNFPDFLSRFLPARSVPYLADVARLEWAVNRALHAPDAPLLDLGQLVALGPDEQDRLRLTSHPSLTVLRAAYPADAIWSAVLDGDDQQLATLDLSGGPAFLVVERVGERTSVARMTEEEWRFLHALCAGTLLPLALEAAPEGEAAAWLAGHLHAGRFVSFTVSDNPPIMAEGCLRFLR